MVIIEAESTINKDLLLVVSKYGPLEQQLHNKLLNTGLRVSVVNTRDEEVKRQPGKAVLLLDDVFESLIIASLFNETLNPRTIYEMAINRALLFKELNKLGYSTPNFSVALNPNVVAKVIRGIGRTYMVTPTPVLGLDGAVTTWEGGKSVAEHRMYMENPLARISILMKAPDKVLNTQVIGNHCINCNNLGDMLLRLTRSLNCIICTYIVGIYGNEPQILGIDPRIELTMENLDYVVSAITGWYNGEW
ncbi:MAG: hypothetical protein ACP5L5_10630 [Vulcanisaeta sp.]|uniref:hypothetical protein n=1 Tax=Vulcanisaeta sp. TaxID=2020871 RepID=UPI003D136171